MEFDVQRIFDVLRVALPFKFDGAAELPAVALIEAEMRAELRAFVLIRLPARTRHIELIHQRDMIAHADQRAKAGANQILSRDRLAAAIRFRSGMAERNVALN